MAKPDDPIVVRAKNVQTNPAIRPYSDAKTAYVESLGINRFYVGACFDRWSEDFEALAEEEGVSKVPGEIGEIIEKVATAVSPEAAAIARWLMQHGCLRLRADLRAYEYAGTRYWAVDALRVGDLTITAWDGRRGDVVARMVEDVREHAPMDLPQKSGVKRVWILPSYPTMTRHDDAIVGLWALDGNEGSEAIVQELIPEDALRRMLLVISRSGAFTREDLERSSGQRRDWAPSVASQVSDEYPGLED